jgi:hypothetical protein
VSPVEHGGSFSGRGHGLPTMRAGAGGRRCDGRGAVGRTLAAGSRRAAPTAS